MTVSADQSHVSTYLDRDLADRFRAWARRGHGGTSAALRSLIAQALDEAEGLHGASLAAEAIAPSGTGRGKQVGFRLKAAERRLLDQIAEQRGTTPANWVRSLVLAHIAQQPQWTPAELEAMRELFREIRAIGNNVNQIARALNVAVQSGDYPPHQGRAAKEAAELIRSEMRRIAAVMTGNFDYWGLPDAERPTAAPGAAERADAEARAAEAARKRRPRRRPARFAESE